ncbi:LysE family translocator [Erythrobacter insulae]|uniref:LysE family translocator n=1 Tax=Erythrobacter insulae TaxID=2584124 RepID=A0A547PF36_9SPHN|nr:LysE family translocator [Erythrobacter insulae]TRD12765.1 LysE family translocator [Erythrobacter insulae]
MDLIGFAIAVMLIELTPGPNMGWLIALTLSEGRKSGLATIWGISLGLATNAVISVLAASYILRQSALLSQGIAFLGAGMMAYLAWQAWQDAGESSPSATPPAGGRRNMIAGFVINLFNPKATLFFVTVMPQFVSDGRPSYGEGLTMAAISVAIATAVHLALILGAEKVRYVLMHRQRAKTVRRILALGMLGVGAWFLTKAFV